MSTSKKRNLSRKMSTNSTKKETEKYVKFFTYKSLQVIVHSRSGDKSKTSSKANAVGVDWFNIAIPGGNIETEIQKEVKNEFANKSPVVQDPLWLNVYLKTAEGHDSLLETWNICFTDKADASIKNCFDVYNKLSLLLKSLISVTRSLPAYQLTRKKEKDFSFYYKILAEPPTREEISELPEKNKVGSVATMFGAVLISVFFKMNIRFDSSEVSQVRYSLGKHKKIPIKASEEELHLSPLGPAAVEELAKAALDDIVSSTASLPTSFSTASPHRFDLSQMQQGLAELGVEIENISEPQSIGHIDDENRPLAAFVDDRSAEPSNSSLPEMPSTPPFLSFIQGKIEESIIESPRSESKELFKDSVSIEKVSRQNDNLDELVAFENTDGEPTAQAVGYEDDFVLVEVRPAFAPQFGDAGQLYRDCQSPPKLDMFSASQESDDCLMEKIEKYGLQMEIYDDFFKNLENMKVT